MEKNCNSDMVELKLKGFELYDLLNKLEAQKNHTIQQLNAVLAEIESIKKKAEVIEVKSE